MAENRERIEQFRKMAEADPTNEIGHFSLGRELFSAGQYDAAVQSLRRVIELNPNISKAYQLVGEALLKQNQRDEAIKVLTDGVRIADSRGEVLPRKEMIQLLTDAGAPVPELAVKPGAKLEVGEGDVLCKRCGRINKKLPRPPFKNPFGQQIFENTCADCWREAIGLGTKVINELRLPMADPQAQKIWDQHIREFLNLG
ncbi:MAG TPA: Fe(2+)-trafficking protein [Tepidisphaeraceae bacterium]|nr:Fe(2+)-trafficking protein [Tepidisphaeraceae bacterium]